MIKDGKYRFSLQFSADDEKHLRAGAFLEKLNNRKSCIVVEALNEYMDNHPELENTQNKIEIKITSPSAYSREKLEQMIRTLVEERISAMKESYTIQQEDNISEVSTLDEDIATMLDNINLF